MNVVKNCLIKFNLEFKLNFYYKNYNEMRNKSREWHKSQAFEKQINLWENICLGFGDSKRHSTFAERKGQN